MGNELDLLAESHVVTDKTTVACLQYDCVQLVDAKGEPRLLAAQHVRKTGHTVMVRREFAEELMPKLPAPRKSGYAAIAEQAAAERGKARKEARKRA